MEDKGYQNTANFGQNTSSFCKLHLNYNLISSYKYLVNHFILFWSIFFSQIINPWKNQQNSSFPPNIELTTYSRMTRDQARKHDSYLWRYNDWCLKKVTRNYYTPDTWSCNIGNYLIKPQSERHIIIPVMFFNNPRGKRKQMNSCNSFESYIQKTVKHLRWSFLQNSILKTSISFWKKPSISDVWQGYKYASLFFLITNTGFTWYGKTRVTSYELKA